ncbi:MAG: hypothetical protein SGBAC_011471 [Bacillariaceae sp.]
MKLSCLILLGQICISASFITPKYKQSRSAASAIYAKTVKGPDVATKPDYEQIHGPLGKALDRLFLTIFRTRMAEQVGVDSALPKDDYEGLMELAAAMNARFSDRSEVQKTAQNILRSLFPSWLPGQYSILFSGPFPEFSARMNAWATRVGGTWLMGECELNDIEIDGKVYKDQGLLVKRCRFLEESGCASVCVNACKIPTQNFFIEDMGLPLTMTPDYETHECQFSFGRMPTVEEEIEAKGTPCLSRCPTAGSLKKWHDGSNRESVDLKSISLNETSSSCQYMDTT